VKNFLLKFREASVSVAPIAVSVLALHFAFGGIKQPQLIWQLLISSAMLILGMTLFSLGVDVAMVDTGNLIGAEIPKTRKLGVIILVCFFLGALVTVAEPDVLVLADQLASAVNKYLLIATVGIGVGILMVIAALRIIFGFKFKTLIIITYSIIFILAIFAPTEYLPMAFDSGGVTTGALTTPFLLALGMGLAASKQGNDMDDNFGILALCSAGPILAVLLLGFAADKEALSRIVFPTPEIESEIIMPFLRAMPDYVAEVSIAIAPVLILIIIFNFARLRLSRRTLAKTAMGFIYVYVGMIIFLTGVNVGFAPAGKAIAANMIGRGTDWVIIPVGTLFGLFTVMAEPAIHVLTEQIEEISGGTLKKRTMSAALMIGVALAAGLTMARVLFRFSIWWILLPGYALALILTFFSPKMFTAVAFDSGGVASGTMTASFILPFATGATIALGGNVLTDAFGVVAVVAMVPIMTIQMMGVISVIKSRRGARVVPAKPYEIVEQPPVIPVLGAETVEILDFDDIISFDEETKADEAGKAVAEPVEAKVEEATKAEPEAITLPEVTETEPQAVIGTGQEPEGKAAEQAATGQKKTESAAGEIVKNGTKEAKVSVNKEIAERTGWAQATATTAESPKEEVKPAAETEMPAEEKEKSKPLKRSKNPKRRI